MPWNRILVPVIQLNVVHICSTDVAPAILPQGTSYFFYSDQNIIYTDYQAIHLHPL